MVAVDWCNTVFGDFLGLLVGDGFVGWVLGGLLIGFGWFVVLLSLSCLWVY